MIKKVGVIGSGQMGNGIAHVAALAGFDVVLNDVSADRLKSGMATINGNLSRQVSKKIITEDARKQALGRIASAETIEGLAGVPCGASALTPPAFGARVQVEELLAREVGDALGAERSRARNEIRIDMPRVEGQLNDARSIAEIEKDDSAEIPRAVHPSAQTHARADVSRPETAGEVGALAGGEDAGVGRTGHGASDSRMTRRNSSESTAAVRAERSWSRRSNREMRLNAFTCALDALSGPTSRKKSCTGFPSSASKSMGDDATPAARTS
jgi:hypothetical protein